MAKRKRLLILGATGSIGLGVRSVLREQRERFTVAGLSARTNWRDMVSVAREFQCESLALVDETERVEFEKASRSSGVQRTYLGPNAMESQAAAEDYDLLVNAVVGGAGILPTLAALSRGISVALANKETLVAAGPLVRRAANEAGARLLPIDSEHSAIFQCLAGENPDCVRRLWLTTSGGPFWNRRRDDLTNVSVESALAHPTWRMGTKVTIDSATLFNKGLEIIEAERLFDIPSERISVVRHAQSVIHSMVEFMDGSIKAQLSTPDMRLPILVALSWPERLPSHLVRTHTDVLSSLTFETVIEEEFPCLQLARRALNLGGTAPAVLSAADEVAVEAFLSGRTGFTDIPRVMNEVLNNSPEESLESVEQIVAADSAARARAREVVDRMTVAASRSA